MKTTKIPGRRNLIFNLSLPADEAQRMRDFAAMVGRPMSWVLRDALRLYLDRMEADAKALAARTRPEALPVDEVPPPPLSKAGRPLGAKGQKRKPKSDN